MDIDDPKYKSFYKQLKIKSDVQDWDFDTIEELRILMTENEFRVAKDKKTGVYYKKKVSDKQVSLAWEYLRKKSRQSELQTRYYDYTKRGGYRAGVRRVRDRTLPNFARPSARRPPHQKAPMPGRFHSPAV